MNEQMFESHFEEYKNKLAKTFPENIVILMMNAYLMGFSSLSNHLNEELGSFVEINVVLDKILEIGPKVEEVTASFCEIKTKQT